MAIALWTTTTLKDALNKWNWYTSGSQELMLL